MSEREVSLSSEREREREREKEREREREFVEIIFMFSGFTATIGAHSISKEVVGFSPYGFHEENYFCLWSLVIITMHVSLSDKILR